MRYRGWYCGGDSSWNTTLWTMPCTGFSRFGSWHMDSRLLILESRSVCLDITHTHTHTTHRDRNTYTLYSYFKLEYLPDTIMTQRVIERRISKPLLGKKSDAQTVVLELSCYDIID